MAVLALLLPQAQAARAGVVHPKPARQGQRPPALRASLQRTVEILATDIGPRHVGAPQAYARTAKAITAHLERWAIPHESMPLPDAPDAPPIIIAYPDGIVPPLRPDAPNESPDGEPALHNPAPPLVLCAHYDTTPGTPGAADNASGVAVLLETARLLHSKNAAASTRAKTPGPSDVPLHIAFFPNEEEPFFMTPQSGSVAYAAMLTRRGVPPGLAVAVDTVGLSPRAQSTGILAALFGTGATIGARSPSRALADDLSTALATTLPVETVITDAGGQWIDHSDHAAFLQGGWQGALVTSPGVALAACMHDACDTPDKLDFQVLEKTVLGLMEFVSRTRRPGAPKAAPAARQPQPHRKPDQEGAPQ